MTEELDDDLSDLLGDDQPKDPAFVEKTLGEISKDAQALKEAEAEIARLETELSEKKALKQKLEEDSLPERMRQLKMLEVTLEDGSKIKLKDLYRGSVSQDNMPDAVEWLEGHELGGIVKNSTIIVFGKDDDEGSKYTRSLVNDLIKATLSVVAPMGVIFSIKQEIHPQTLYKTIRECMEGGTDLPEIFNPRHIQVAEIKPPKKGKK